MKETVKVAAEKLKLSPKLVEQVYKAYWAFIKQHIEELPLKESITEEQFESLRKNFNLPNLGKLYCSHHRFKNYRNVEHKEDKTDV